MQIQIQHLNSLDAELDHRTIESDGNENLTQHRIKQALISMIDDNVLDAGDKFVIVEIS